MKYFAMLGKWHVHAEGYANELNSVSGCKVKKVWDPDTATAKAWAEQLGCAETGNEWKKAEKLPERVDSPLVQWAKAEKPEEISKDFDIEVAVRLTRVMVEAYQNPKD